MTKNIVVAFLAIILTAGVFVAAEQVDARTTHADMKAECSTSSCDEVKKSDNCCPSQQEISCPGMSSCDGEKKASDGSI